MGWYAGRLGCLVATSRRYPAARQPAAVFEPATRTVTTTWRATATIRTTGWPPGFYLLRLDGADGGQQFVPVAVRTPSAARRTVLVAATTTWAAYNMWGGRDLYMDSAGSFADRSRVVTFDRPFAAEDGAGEFLERELPLLAVAERLRLPLDYVTDSDLEVPGLLAGARAVVSGGHDEYWSARMRAAVTTARDAGTNVAFFGANAVFRRIRFTASPDGPYRLVVNYKVAAEDPLDGRDTAVVTADWPAQPRPDPESTLTGTMYDCHPARADGVVADARSWVFAGTGVSDGDRLLGVVGPESDRVNPAWPTPHPIEVLLHSPLLCHGNPTYSDASIYAATGGAAVFSAGTIDWVCDLAGVGHCHEVGRRTEQVLQRVTENVLRAFAAGPAAAAHPPVENLARLGIGPSRGPY
jgi:hypothetical protein